MGNLERGPNLISVAIVLVARLVGIEGLCISGVNKSNETAFFILKNSWRHMDRVCVKERSGEGKKSERQVRALVRGPFSYGH